MSNNFHIFATNIDTLASYSEKAKALLFHEITDREKDGELWHFFYAYNRLCIKVDCSVSEWFLFDILSILTHYGFIGHFGADELGKILDACKERNIRR